MAIKTIFTDCFDTILLRKKSPDHIWVDLASSITEIYSDLANEKLTRIFINAEKYVAKFNKKEFGEAEYTLQDIFACVKERLELYSLTNCDLSNFIQDCIDKYLECEKAMQVLNAKIVNFLKAKKNDGCKIYVVSDFYCAKSMLIEMFKFHNIAELFDDVFVSCDYKKSKGTGELYNLIVEKLNLNKSEILMIGDNVHSDQKVPKSLGINIKPVKAKKNLSTKSILEKVKLDNEFKQIFKLKNNYNYSNYCFPLYEFIDKLAKSLMNKQVKNVFFLSREGQFLKKLFDKYVELNKIEIKSHYLKVSRNSVLLASLDKLEEESFDNMIYSNVTMSAMAFLKTLEFSDEEINLINVAFDLNENFKDFKSSSSFKVLKENENFIKTYNKKRSEQKNNFSELLSTFHVNFYEDGMTIVDVGWRGTMQDCLSKFFNDKVKITGYYVGYMHEKNLSANSVKHGLLYSDCPFEPTVSERLYNFKILNYEEILRADHNRVCGYVKKDEKIECVYDNEVDDASFYMKNIEILQNQIYQKFIKICELDKGLDDIYKICNLTFFKMMNKTNAKDLKLIYKCVYQHYDSFARIGKIKKKDSFIVWCMKFYLNLLKLNIKILLKKF